MKYFTPVEIPDGSYTGKMSGHNLWWTFDGQQVHCQTNLGVRGHNVPVAFSIVDGRVDEDTINQVGSQDE